MNCDAERAAIAKTTAHLLEAVNASDVDGVMSLWADDGVLMPPNHPSVHGREAIEMYFRNIFRRATFRFQFTSSDIQIADAVVLERVTYTVETWLAGSGPPLTDRGKGLHVYNRQPNGSWKLAMDIWNSDLAAFAHD